MESEKKMSTRNQEGQLNMQIMEMSDESGSSSGISSKQLDPWREYLKDRNNGKFVTFSQILNC